MPEATPGGITKICLTDALGVPYDLSQGGSGVSSGEYGPADYGLLGWTYDPSLASSSSLLGAAGTVSTIRFKNRVAGSCTNLVLACANAGVTLTAGQCFAALFQGGSLLGVTADQQVNWQSTGVKIMPLVGGPVPYAASDLILAWYANGTTMPGWFRCVSFSPLINIGLSAANSRYGTADTGRTTTMPNPLGTIAAANPAWWGAWS